jgi:hypothetical protein
MCRGINKAAEALREGTKLKHLLLEEGRDLERGYSEITRGM